MVNALVEPWLMGDHIGYHILHWIITQSGLWYSKLNENFQNNLRTIESGVAVIDEILTPDDDDFYFYENNQLGNDNRLYRFYYNCNNHHNLEVNSERRSAGGANDNENVNNFVNQLHRNDHLLLGILHATAAYYRSIFIAILCVNKN